MQNPFVINRDLISHQPDDTEYCLFDPSKLTQHQYCCFSLAVCHFITVDQPLLCDNLDQQLKILERNNIPYVIVDDLTDWTVQDYDHVVLLLNDHIKHAYVCAKYLNCQFDINDLDFTEIYNSPVPHIIKGDDDLGDHKPTRMSDIYKTDLTYKADIISLIHKFVNSCTNNPSGDDDLIKDMSFTIRNNGLCTYDTRWKTQSQSLQIKQGKNKIMIVNSPSTGCAIFSILNFIQPSPVEEWIELIDMFIQFDIQTESNTGQRWQQMKNDNEYSDVPALILQLMKNYERTHGANFLDVADLTSVRTYSILDIIEEATEGKYTFGPCGFFLTNLINGRPSHCMSYNTQSNFMDCKVLDINRVKGFFILHLQKFVSVWQQDEQSKLTDLYKKKIKKGGAKQKFQKTNLSRTVNKVCQDLNQNASTKAKNVTQIQCEIKVVKKKVTQAQEMEKQFYFKLRQIVTNYGFNSDAFKSLPKEHEHDSQITLSIWKYRTLQLHFLPLIPLSQIQVMCYHELLKVKSDVYKLTPKITVFKAYKLDPTVHNMMRTKLGNDQIIKLNGLQSQISDIKQARDKHIKVKDLVHTLNDNLLTNKAVSKLKRNQTKSKGGTDYTNITVKNHLVSLINLNVPQSTYAQLATIFSEYDMYQANDVTKRTPSFTITRAKDSKVIIHNKIQGMVANSFATYCTPYTQAFNKTAMKNAGSDTGGHPCHRHLNDVLQSQNLEIAFNSILNAPRSHKNLNLIHVGSKFSVMTRLSYDALRKDLRNIIGSHEDMQQRCIKRGLINLERNQQALINELVRFLNQNPRYKTFILAVIESNKCSRCLRVYLTFLREVNDLSFRLAGIEIERQEQVREMDIQAEQQQQQQQAQQPQAQRQRQRQQARVAPQVLNNDEEQAQQHQQQPPQPQARQQPQQGNQRNRLVINEHDPVNYANLDEGLFHSRDFRNFHGALHVAIKGGHNLSVDFLHDLFKIYLLEHQQSRKWIQEHVVSCVPQISEDLYKQVWEQALLLYQQGDTPGEIVQRTEVFMTEQGYDWSCCDEQGCSHIQEQPEVNVYHIRPAHKDDSYNATYYVQHIDARYQYYTYNGLDTWYLQERNVNQYIIQGTIQEFEEACQLDTHFQNVPNPLTRDSVNHIIMNDVHYYLGQYQCGIKGVIYTSGTNHNPVEGRYTMAQGEGSVQVSPSSKNRLIAQMAQLSRGTNVPYEHEVVHINDPTVSIPFGWYTMFRDVSTTLNWNAKIQRQFIVRTHPLFSQQTQFFRQYLDTFATSVKTLKTFQDLECQWRPLIKYQRRNNSMVTTGDILLTFNDEEYKTITEPQALKQLQYQIMSYTHKQDLFESENQQLILESRVPHLFTNLTGGYCYRTLKTSFDLNMNNLESQGPLHWTKALLMKLQEKIKLPTFFSDIDEGTLTVIDQKDKNRILLNGRSKIGCFIQTSQIIGLLDVTEDPKSYQFLKDLSILNSKSVTNKHLHEALRTLKPLKQSLNVDVNKATVSVCLQQDYLMAKSIDDTMMADLQNPNPEVIKDKNEYDKYLFKPLIKLLKDNPKACMWSTAMNKYTTQISKQHSGIASGWDVMQDGRNIGSFEYGSKFLQNKIAGLCRQFSGQIPIDPAYLACYEEVSDKYIEHIFQKALNNPEVDRWIDEFNMYDFYVKPEWSHNKIKSYQENFLRQISDPGRNNFCGPLKQNIKVGEVHMYVDNKTGQTQPITKDCYDDDNCLINTDTKPRIFGAVSKKTAGITVAAQQIVINILKICEPSFIHGKNHESLLDGIKDEGLIRELIGYIWQVICADGSAWDSSQMKKLQRGAEIKFVRKFKEFFEKAFHNKYNRQFMGNNDWDNLWNNLITSWDQEYSYNFIQVQGVNAPQWSPDVEKMFAEYFPEDYIKTRKAPWNHYVYSKTCGTTQSGRDLETTFGNSLRNLLYLFTYLTYHEFHEQPWLDKRIFPIVAGDDLAIFVQCQKDDGLVEQIKQIMLDSTSKQKSVRVPIGLGQCIKQSAFVVGDLNSMEFCSKWFYSPDGSLGKLNYCRNIEKLMCTKMFYTGSNTAMRDDPWLHSLAILRGLESEQVSVMLEDMFRLRVMKYGNFDTTQREEDLFKSTDYVRFALLTETPYSMQREVHRRLNIDLSDFFRVVQHNTYRMNGIGEEDDSIQKQILEKEIEITKMENNKKTNQMDNYSGGLHYNDKRSISQTQYKNILKELTKINQDKLKHQSDNNPITSMEVQRLNMKNLDQQFQIFNNNILDIKKAFDKGQDYGIEDLVRQYKENNTDLVSAIKDMKELMEPLRGMGLNDALGKGVNVQNWSHLQQMKRQNALTFPNLAIQDKIAAGLIPIEGGTGSADDLKRLLEILENEGIDVGDLPTDLQTFRAILLLNNWQEIAKRVGAKLFSYGKQVITPQRIGQALQYVSPVAYNIVKNLSQELPKYVDTGADSGIWHGDQSTRSGQMDKYYSVPGVNEFSNNMPRNLMGAEDMLAVDYQFIATFICPKSYAFREPQDYPIKTALITSTQTLNLTTNARGECLIFLNPDLPAKTRARSVYPQTGVDGIKQRWSDFWMLDATALLVNSGDLASGTLQTWKEVTTLPGVYSGPLQEVASQISSYKTTGFSVSLKSVSSDLNNSGLVRFAYFPRSAIGSITNGQPTLSSTYTEGKGQPLGTNAMDTAPYHQQGNFKTGYRFNHVPHPQKYPADEDSYLGNKLDELYAIAVSGAEPSTTIGSIEVSYVYEYIPVFTSQLMSVRQYPALGSRSGDFISTMLQKYPALMTMVEEDAYVLASRIYQSRLTNPAELDKVLADYFNRNN